MGLVGRGERVAVPHEAGCTVTLKPLSGAQLDEARRRARTRALEALRSLQGFDLAAAMRAAAEAPAQIRQGQPGAEAAADTTLDPDTLLDHGLVGWDGPAYLGEDGKPVPCTADTKRTLLDDATRTWVLAELVRRNTRPS